ncbi:MAG: DUF3450 family protein [Fibrobacterota bacterium]
MRTLIFLFLFAAAVFPQDASDTVSLRTKIRELEKETSSLREALVSDSARFQNYLNSTNELIGDGEKEIGILKNEITRVKKEEERVYSKTASVKRKIENLSEYEKRMREAILAAAQDLKKHISAGIPLDREKRLEPVDLLIREILQESISFEEAFVRLNAVYSNEEARASLIEVTKKEMTAEDGASFTADVLRMGNIFSAYHESGGKRAGVLVPRKGKQGYEWETSLSLKERLAVKKAIEVKTGKDHPQIVEIPLPAEALEGDEK